MAKPAAKSPAVYLVYGPETFLRRRALRELLAARKGRDDLGPTRFEGASAAVADVLDEVRTVSLLGGERTVIVEDAEGLISKPKQREVLERYCAAPSPTGCLILVCDAFDRRFRLFKIIQEHGAVIACDAPKPGDVPDWLTRQAREAYDKQIARPAAQRLRELTGDSLAMLDSELEKLSIYVGARRTIEVDDVDALVGAVREQLVFAVVDAMHAGDAATALRLWRRVVETDRSAEGRAIGGLAFAVRRALQARCALDRGLPLATVTSQPWQQQQLARQVQRLTAAELEDQLSDLLKADLATKTGLAEFDSAVEPFILKHTHKSIKEDRGHDQAA